MLIESKIKRINELVPLEEINGNFKCQCPYHNSSTAINTLVIDTNLKLFHCFGCGRSGSLDELIEKLEEGQK